MVFTHSSVIRSRTPFFAHFFDDEDWTRYRWDNGMVTIDVKHLHWDVMQYVLRFICYGEEGQMFDEWSSNSGGVDGLVEFMFQVMAAAVRLALSSCSFSI
jgi:hypothetical protein